MNSNLKKFGKFASNFSWTVFPFLLAVSFGEGANAQPRDRSAPVINWAFENNLKSNSENVDALGKAKITTQFEKPDFVDGVIGRAWRSDGFSSFVSEPLSLSPEQGFTFSAFVALESYPSGYELPIKNIIPAALAQQWDNDRGFGIFMNPYGDWWLKIATVEGILEVRAETKFPLYKWNKVAAIYDPLLGVAKLFLNEKCVGAYILGKQAKFKPANTPFEIAHSNTPAPLLVFNINGINGAFDEVKIYNFPLSDLEIKTDFNKVKLPPVSNSLSVPATRFAKSVDRPIFHAIPPANWTNEPHGLTRRGDEWHIFYQRTDNGPFKTLMNWGHMSSKDLVNWTYREDALRPDLQTENIGFDMKGIWSGDVVNGPDGNAYAFYTSVNHSSNYYNPGISVAISKDEELSSWGKLGPILDSSGFRDFRDPFVWIEDGQWKMIVGAALSGKGGGLAYYKCLNVKLANCWKRQSPIAPFEKMDIGSDIWEMPIIERISADKYILLANPIGGEVTKYGNPATRAVYWIGKWDGKNFKPDFLRPKMLDLVPGNVSPTIDRDKDGNIVAIGIVDERRSPQAQKDAGWAHLFGLPRNWRLLSDGKTLGQTPISELEGLRINSSSKEVSFSDVKTLNVGSLSQSTEILAKFDKITQGTNKYGLRIASSKDGSEKTEVYYDKTKKQVVVDKSFSTIRKDGEGPLILRGNYDEAAFGEPKEFHIFIDHSVVEVFINNAAAFSVRIYPNNNDSDNLAVISDGSVSGSIKAWKLGPAGYDYKLD